MSDAERVLSLSLISQSIDLKQLSLESKPSLSPAFYIRELTRLRSPQAADQDKLGFHLQGLLQLPGASDEGLRLVNPLRFSSLEIFTLQRSKENSTTSSSKLCLQQWFYSNHSFQHHVLPWSFPRRGGSLFLCTAFLCAAPTPCLRRAVA